VVRINPTAAQPTPPDRSPSSGAGENLDSLYQAVFRRALYLMGNRTAAEDTAQETFLRYLSRRPAGLTSPLAWLITVCTRLCFDRMRSGRRHQTEPLNEAALMANSRGLPEEVLLDREEAQMARQALESLDPRERMLLLLRHSGTPYRALAAAAGCAEGSVGPLLHRAERRFRAAYERLAESGPSR
jgi:RNA polymerase sigma factor (sigma-70 family)